MSYPSAMYGATDPESQVSSEVQAWFAAVDRDGSGKITASELQSALANGQGGHFSDTACKLMIGMFDREKDGTINLVEFQALYNYINAWLGVFRGFDRDNSGSIQENELSMALTQMGYRLSPEFISFLIKKSDLGNHQSITVDQFIVLCVQIQMLTEAFRVKDTDQTGTISISFEDFLGIALNWPIWFSQRTNCQQRISDAHRWLIENSRESNDWNQDSILSHTRQAQERIQEFARLQRARHLLDAISLVNELLSDGSDVEILSLAATVIKRLKVLGVMSPLPSRHENSSDSAGVSMLKPGHTGIYHCCTFCSSGGRKDVACGCRGTMPGGYRGCGHGHPGHPGVHHWSCCGSILRYGRCLIHRRSIYQLLL